jgi:hypothetical protein
MLKSVGKLQQPLNLDFLSMKQIFLAALACAFFSTGAQVVHAQSNDVGPIVTPSGTLLFVRDDRDFVATLNSDVFDRFDANKVVHFDDLSSSNDKLARTLVQTDSGPVLYDFRRNPPLVQRTGRRMVVKRVFWQGEEVVMQSAQGWFSFQRGTLTKLQSSTSVYH